MATTSYACVWGWLLLPAEWFVLWAGRPSAAGLRINYRGAKAAVGNQLGGPCLDPSMRGLIMGMWVGRLRGL